jgi:hypothetical protein
LSSSQASATGRSRRSTGELGRSSRSRRHFAGRGRTAAASRYASTWSRESNVPGRDRAARASQAGRRCQSRRRYPHRRRRRASRTISRSIEGLAASPPSSIWVGVRLHRAFSPRQIEPLRCRAAPRLGRFICIEEPTRGIRQAPEVQVNRGNKRRRFRLRRGGDPSRKWCSTKVLGKFRAAWIPPMQSPPWLSAVRYRWQKLNELPISGTRLADGLGPPAGSWAHGNSSADPTHHTKNMEYSGSGSSWATRARPMAMMVATMPSIRSVLLSLAGLRLPAGPGRPRHWRPSSE